MSARRHLPVLNSPPPAPSKPSATTDSPHASPPWHWIPLGTVVSVVVFALFAPAAASLSTRVLARVYPPGASAAEIVRIRNTHTYAVITELAAGAVPLVALLASVALGGYVIGRYGPRTNARHGMLSGATTALLFWAITGWLPTMLVVTPVAMLVAWGATRSGVAVRNRDLASTTG